MIGRIPARKIAVIGAGVVGVPMAALLAESLSRTGPAAREVRVVLIQRPSITSGWKVAALNAGQNPLGGLEPGLAEIIARTVREGRLAASTDPAEARDAEAILVCVQTDKKDFAPDYDPLFEALDSLAVELRKRPPTVPVPLVVIESTLAPTSMTTVVRERLADRGLRDGTDIDLGFSPNRVMPGHLIERIRGADKIISGLRSETAARIRDLYSAAVSWGRLYEANPLTAEVVKTLENAWRDVRIAYAAEIARACDAADVDFHALRTRVNARLAQEDAASVDPTAVPTGGLLIPTCGVGGHCLPKDGILLLWRWIEAGGNRDHSLILEARRINDASPAETVIRIEEQLGPLAQTSVVLLGAAYRPGAADTRNSPALAVGRIISRRCRAFALHDPYVRRDDPRLAEHGLASVFTNDLPAALADAEIAVIGTAHPLYRRELEGEFMGPSVRAVFDGAHLFLRDEFAVRPLVYEGVGKGRNTPAAELTDIAIRGFHAVERGLAHEIGRLVEFLNARFAGDEAGRISLEKVRVLVSTCATGCVLGEPGPAEAVPDFLGRRLRLPALAVRIAEGRP
jgi:UDP-N-acetyl-D-mannosaminuronic acid dehydrogenase